MKNWYLLREVEYSTDFEFFIQNQITVVFSRGILNFFSNLECFTFKSFDYDMEDKEVLEMVKIIHQDLLNHKYGKGEFVD